MATNISESTNSTMSTMDILKTMDWCMKKEKKREEELSKMGPQDNFKRSSKESEELAMNSKISMRMKITLAEKSSTNNTRAARNQNAIVDQIIEDNCNELTAQLQEQTRCPASIVCDSRSEFRHISACCNNLQNTKYGK